jgi:Ca2+-binding RTX toxin-like protein
VLRPAALVLSVLLIASTAGTADAAFVRKAPNGLQYVAAVGERNALTIAAGPPGTLVFTDPGATIGAGTNCTSVAPHEAACSISQTGSRGVLVRLRDRNDRAEATFCPTGCSTNVSVIFFDGAGNDLYVGGAEDNGYRTSRRPHGSDTFHGGEGHNYADYLPRRAGVSVTLDGRRNDGEPGERDLVTAVQDVVGGEGNDVLVGDALVNWLIGHLGNDRVRGRGGNDDLRGDSGSDSLSGGAGNDVLRARAGADLLAGGPGLDSLQGGVDNDVYYARDGNRDNVFDGGGIDRARVDRGLDVVRGIESFF